MGNRTSGYGWMGDPNYSAKLTARVQQERPDGTLWSVEFFLNGSPQTGSKQFFGSEKECEDFAFEQMAVVE